jgi:exo-beta-1,3-glucanase (GH17 family)
MLCRRILISFVLLVALRAVPASAAAPSESLNLAEPGWHGNAIAYSGFRAGEHPDTGPYPAQDRILEDMRILAKNWKLIRLYSSDRQAEDVLAVIRRDQIGLKVMLGAYLSGKPDKLNNNSLEVARVIRLANAYPDIVVAVSVGNEILVSWSDHPVSEPQALAVVEEVKRHVTVPVTVADDSLYWRDPAARLAGTVDFITMHTYPMWDGQDIDTALSSTVKNYELVRSAHPGKTVVIGEAGWASYTDSRKNFRRAGDEAKQKRYFEELSAWAEANGVTVFIFEAFDEPWKGSGTEGHWGLFSEGRNAKLVMRQRYPELATDAATSPAYDDPAPSAEVGRSRKNKDKK